MIRAAFLRGMNLGNRRITNADLRAEFERLGFDSVATFQAAGNVVFEAGDANEEELVATIEAGLEAMCVGVLELALEGLVVAHQRAMVPGRRATAQSESQAAAPATSCS